LRDDVTRVLWRKDTATTVGPYLVTLAELEPYRDADGSL
jgi:hypothetical protein